MFGEFNEATQLKISLAKYLIEFNELAVQMRPHRIAYLRLLLGIYVVGSSAMKRSYVCIRAGSEHKDRYYVYTKLAVIKEYHYPLL